MFQNTLIKIESINLTNDIMTFKNLTKTDTTNMSINDEEDFLNGVHQLMQSIIERVIQSNPSICYKEIEWELNR